MQPIDWRGGVRVVRAASLDAAKGGNGTGRATVFDFASGGPRGVWIGSVTLAPGRKTGAHHHGRHEVMFYVASGQVEVRWGERLEYAANLEPGDYAYFQPNVPHQERNRSDTATVEFVVVRSDGERIVSALRVEEAERPEFVA